MRILRFFLLLLLSNFAVTSTYSAVKKGDVTVRVVVNNVKSSKGVILVGLFDKETGTFELEERYDGVELKAQDAVDKEISYEFKAPKGSYVAVAIHDKNSNHYLDKNFFGLPREPYAISNGLRIPNWNRSLVDVDGDTEVQLYLR